LETYQITPANLERNIAWLNEENLWISIPKNANTQMRKVCKDVGLIRQTIPDDSSEFKNTICVLRNPTTRLISALGEFKARFRTETDTIQNLLFEFIEEPLNFDEHLEPQLAFITGHAFTNILMFESLFQELQTIPIFRYNNVKLKQRINPIQLNMSRHFYPESIEKIYFDNQRAVDHAVNKYYQRDLEMWLEPLKFINKVIE
jgi:hypothetical protein